MALWDKVRELEGSALRQIQSLYGPNFPIQFRHYFASLIENQAWDRIDPDNVQGDEEAHAKYILDLFLSEIHKECDCLTEGKDFLQRLHLSEIASHFKHVYGSAPLELVRIVKKILAIESRLVQQDGNKMESFNAANALHAKNSLRINQELDQLMTKTRDAEQELRNLQSEQEYFVIKYQDNARVLNELQHYQQRPQTDPGRIQMEQSLIRKSQEFDKLLRTGKQKILQMRMALGSHHQDLLLRLSHLQKEILNDQLSKWKRSQALAYNGALQRDNDNLDQLQQWCERLAEIVWQSRQQIKRLQLQRAQLPFHASARDVLSEQDTTITDLLLELIASAFVIEKQPPQVLKTQTRFGATVRLLIGGKLNVHMNPPTVKASIISEAQAKTLNSDQRRSVSEVSGEILNPESVMEYHAQSGILSVNFRNMAIMYGLFQVCTISSVQGATTDTCVTTQEFAQSGGILSTENNDLEQATKAMSILSIFLSLISSVASLILGLHKFERNKGFLISAGAHFFTGICVMSGAITYTLLLNNLQEIIPSGTFLFAHLSYNLVWVAMGLCFLSSILSLIGGIVKRD